MRISRRKRPQKPLIQHYKKNQEITASEVLLLGEDGSRIGTMSAADALAKAQEQELDLVEINPKSDPIVARIMDFSDFKYQKEKEARKQKVHSKTSDTKGVRLSVRISDHDLGVKRAQAEKFLSRGDKVKIELILRGRENARPDIAKQTINKFVSGIEETIPIKFEQAVTRQGRKMIGVIVKK